MTTQLAKVDLPDLNLWLALAWGGHRHHASACHYWEEQAADSVVFTTVTALGLVRLLSQHRVMGEAVLSLPGQRRSDGLPGAAGGAAHR